MGRTQPLRVNGRLSIPASELHVSYARSGGPGGQNVNKVETKVVLRFSVATSRVLGDRRQALLQKRLAHRLTTAGDIVLHASRYRERGRNEEDARERLADLLREALQAPRPRRATRPTRASKRRRLEGKQRRSDTKRLRKPPKHHD